MATNGSPDHHRAVIGNPDTFWLYSSNTGFDLTHPPKPNSPPIKPSVTISTTTSPITIDPAKSALVIIDMQNFFLSPALGKARGPGHDALDQLVEHAIPSCRKAGIRVVWVNWGLTEQEVEEMPPAVKRAFGFEAVVEGEGWEDDEAVFVSRKGVFAVNKHGQPQNQGGDLVGGGAKGQKKLYKGIGSDMGTVKNFETGKEIHVGRMLMRDQWNTALCPPLDQIYTEGAKLTTRPDVWIHKNRMSGMWGARTELDDFLEKEGLRTLFFAGVNTDQCVNGTYQDAFSKGYDCVLLSDGCGTTSPECAQQGVEYNAANTCGFLLSCKQLADGVAGIERA
ncbi:Ureidoacrylate amidohydrolase RutB [Fulvia fulva]|uniref:Ureidoacrylate amidohydrolase RutB n=1 Tax=Passalora fulva TaxID=5499 RepID=A0A9Q8LI22_PASFU|nr:Ureidoacrylate amidohydrolase RutB [Fulvia fulva]KAK4624472.1 Ureidoacrylate amidohydrolase RutB [Fulvia fulva]KAK4625769.1 Ureidoacrylate amidohydrolase RutB [Fulvia fulva]UJO17854.1 Ureidoacrylate amidohydrolase RutB [Fulvia fulva]WPV14826.1 Ureidoacrylate amidohydrolase RutB [Fulvia fulva]WPV29501.1 Ureidoacrylate amidohydrolase RutB [Fulvia fulva]